MTKAIMILGTGSDVGKSVSVTALCRIFRRRGFRVAPFKAQNMSNNSYVTVEGGEIGRAQVVQAEASGLLPSVHMNPILLKPSTEIGSQVVVQGKVYGSMDALNYHSFKPRLRKIVMDSYNRLASEYELIVMEGAGSCCEMNLKKDDLVNFPMAKAAGARCILVADIDRGGVFAQVIGTYHLMSRKEKEITIGFLINKFRGDPKLFSDGIAYIEKKTGKPVLGLVPFYRNISIDSEDSVAVQEDKRALKEIDTRHVNIAILRLPAISNFTDLEIMETEKDVVVNYISRPGDLTDQYDLLIIPGTKNVMEDASWLMRTGWENVIKNFVNNKKRLMGICGGYQLLGEVIEDPYGIESDKKVVYALNLLPVRTRIESRKIVRRVTGECLVNGEKVKGYEIHMGTSIPSGDSVKPFLKIKEPGKSKSWPDGISINDGQVSGTYVHGIFDSPGFRNEMLNRIRMEKGIKPRPPEKGRLRRFYQYDRLADHFEQYCDVDMILSKLE